GDRLHQHVILEERTPHQQLADELDGERQRGGAVRGVDDVGLSIDHEADEEKSPLRGDRIVGGRLRLAGEVDGAGHARILDAPALLTGGDARTWSRGTRRLPRGSLPGRAPTP